MLSVIRCLTLVAFAVHAVLGCCLAHGDCTSQTVTPNKQACCQHRHDVFPASSDGFASDHLPANVELKLADHAPFQHQTPGQHTPGQHQQHAPCDDAQCVFGVSDSTTHQPEPLVEWFHAQPLSSPVQLIQDCELSTVRRHFHPHLASWGSFRAMLQVWLI